MDKYTILENVGRYVQLGWSVIPILPATKRPPVKWGKYQSEKATMVDVTRWIEKGWWLALVTGDISGVLVVDDDRIKHNLPEWGFDSEIISQSKSGGRHYYFKYDREIHQSVNNEIRVDIKAWHNYVLLPPFDGRVWIKEPNEVSLYKLGSLSEDLYQTIKYVSKAEGEKLDVTEKLNLADGEGRRDGLYALACSMFNKMDDPDEVIVLLKAVNEGYKPPMTDEEFQHNVERAYEFVMGHPAEKKVEIDLSSLKLKAEVVEEAEIEDMSKFEIESLVDLRNEVMPPQAWLIDNMVPAEGLVLIAGAPATGKSFYSLTMAHAIASGNKWLGQFEVTHTTNTLFIDKENGRRRFQDRMRGLGIGGDGMWRVKQPEWFNFTDRKGVTRFAEIVHAFIKEHDIGLVVLDSLVDLMPGDENKSGDTQVFFDNVRIILSGVAVIILHHEGKDSKNEKSKMDKTRGSSNIPGQVDLAFRVSRIKHTLNEYKFEHTKSRDSAEMVPFSIKMASIPDPLNTKHTLVTQLAYGEQIKEKDPKKLEAVEIITGMLPYRISDDILLKKDMVEACAIKEISEETVKDAIAELKFKKVMGCEPVGIKGYGNQKKFFKLEKREDAINTPNKPYNDD